MLRRAEIYFINLFFTAFCDNRFRAGDPIRLTLLPFIPGDSR